MKRINVIALWAIIVVILMLGEYIVLKSAYNYEPQTTVVYTKAKIPAKEVITSEMLEEKKINISMNHQLSFSGKKDIIGKKAKVDMEAGEMILKSRVGAIDEMEEIPVTDKNKRLYALELKGDQANGWWLKVGQLVDIIYVPSERMQLSNKQAVGSSETVQQPNTEIPLLFNSETSILPNIRIAALIYDLRIFLKFIKSYKELGEIHIKDIDIEVIKNISLGDLYAFLGYLKNERNNKPQSYSKKIYAIKSLYNYLTNKARLIDTNVTKDIEMPKSPRSVPIHLSYEECIKLLMVTNESNNPERDYCIITILLNCGIRLSELVGINITNISGGALSVIGKGDRERMIPLNKACLIALSAYLQVRPTSEDNALFLSERKTRIGKKTVQEMVKKFITRIGLDSKISPHKLRHTSATLMLKNNVGLREIQEVLGHSSIKSTEIYTHVYDTKLMEAVQSNPLSEVNPKPSEKPDKSKKKVRKHST